MLLITTGRYFGKATRTTKIFCPHENCVRDGIEIQSRVMIGLFFVPLVPAARVSEWRCAHCNKEVVPNLKGEQTQSAQRLNTAGAGCGFAMFAFFTFLVFYVGGKNSVFDPSNINATRGFLAMFAFLGFLIMAKALFDARAISALQSKIVPLTLDRAVEVDSTLQSGDDLETIVRKLTEKGFTDPEIRAYTTTWCKPLS